jgi:hypothetical protein
MIFDVVDSLFWESRRPTWMDLPFGLRRTTAAQFLRLVQDALQVLVPVEAWADSEQGESITFVPASSSESKSSSTSSFAEVSSPSSSLASGGEEDSEGRGRRRFRIPSTRVRQQQRQNGRGMALDEVVILLGEAAAVGVQGKRINERSKNY